MLIRYGRGLQGSKLRELGIGMTSVQKNLCRSDDLAYVALSVVGDVDEQAC